MNCMSHWDLNRINDDDRPVATLRTQADYGIMVVLMALTFAHVDPTTPLPPM
jgi:hypothetical protein